MRHLIVATFLLLVLMAPAASGLDCPFVAQDRVQIIVADFYGPDDLGMDPTDWIVAGLHQLTGDYRDVTVIRLSRSLSADDPEADAREILASRDATMVIWGRFEEKDGSIATTPDYITPLQTMSTGAYEEGPSTIMRGSGLIRPGMDYRRSSALPSATYTPETLTGGVWLTMARTCMGIALTTVGRFPEAYEILEEAVASPDPGWTGSRGYGMALLNLGLSSLALDYTDRGIEVFSELLEMDPQASICYMNRGIAYYRLGDYGPAIEDFGRALEVEPEYADVYFQRGLAYCRDGQQQLGIADFDRYLEFFPDDELTIGNRGWAYYELGMLDEAIADLERAVELEGEPESTHNLANLGVAYKDNEQYGEALQCLGAALEIANEPTARELHWQRADCYCYLGLFWRGIQEFTAAIEIRPEEAELWKDRGRAYYFYGNLEAALEDENRAIELSPDWLVPYYWRAKVLSQMGQTPAAITDLQRILDEELEETELRSMAWELMQSLTEE